MILLDTSGLLAALFPDQRHHEAAARTLSVAEPPRLLTPFVLAELDYLVARMAGVDVELELLDEVGREAYSLVDFGPGDIVEARRVMADYRELGIGLADASIVVLARRTGTARLLTLDERHFRVLPGPEGRPFELLPADGGG